jgi:hypothetical protein
MDGHHWVYIAIYHRDKICPIWSHTGIAAGAGVDGITTPGLMGWVARRRIPSR